MKKQHTLESFSNKFYNLYPTSNLIILEILSKQKVKVKSKYGIHILYQSNILKGTIPGLESVINKKEYYINQFLEKFPSSKIKIIKLLPKYKILCTTKFGNCIVTHNSLLKGYLPTIQSAINKNEYFINQAREIHGNKYNYTNVNYLTVHKKIEVICYKHDKFLITPAAHLKGQGCYKCGREITTQYSKENSTGWSYSNWEKYSLKSKNFDSFKVYVIKCWNETEQFYKIGKTYLTLKKRFRSTLMPYKIEIMKVIKGNSLEISKLEKELQKQNKENKYIPKIKFNGMHECFSKINNYEAAIR